MAGEEGLAVQHQIGKGLTQLSQFRGPSSCLERFDLPEEGPPRSLFWSWTQFPWLLLDGQPCFQPTSSSPSRCTPQPTPRWKVGCAVSGPQTVTEGEEGGVCVCVCYRGQHTALCGSQRVLSLGGRNGGQRKRIQAGFQPQQQQQQQAAAEAARRRPHLLAGCRGNGRRRGPSSPRQSKQDRWARARRD